MRRETVKLETRLVGLKLAWFFAVLLVGTALVRADEPYARSRDYDLQHSKIALRFDLENKKVIGDVGYYPLPKN